MNQDIGKTIDGIRKATGVPYLDVVCFDGYKEVFRHVSGDGATGKERLMMYSCTKPMTVVGAMRLVERGVLGLDDEVEKYLPEAKNAYVLDENGKKTPPKQKMTIRNLLSMSAGLDYNVKAEPVLQVVKTLGEGATLRDCIPAFFQSPLCCEPNTKFVYSMCHDVLAAVIEVVSGKKFSAYMDEEILQPLGMQKSYFDNREVPFAKMYQATEQGKIEETDCKNVLLPTKAYESGGAGLISTVEDYALFAKAIANDGVAENGYRLLKKETLQEIYTEQMSRIGCRNFECVQGDGYSYGLGVRTRVQATGWGLPVGEFGWDGWAGSYLMIDPKHKVSVVMGMHLCAWNYVFHNHLDIVRLLYENILKIKG